MEPGDRPMRTVVGTDFGVAGLNRLSQPIRDAALGQLNPEEVPARA